MPCERTGLIFLCICNLGLLTFQIVKRLSLLTSPIVSISFFRPDPVCIAHLVETELRLKLELLVVNYRFEVIHLFKEDSAIATAAAVAP